MDNTKISRIITHSGVFHADEILSMALLEQSGKTGRLIIAQHAYPGPEPIGSVTMVFRVPQVPEELVPDTIVLDMGGIHNPERLRFDHHQDFKIESTCMLTLDWVYKDAGTEEDLFILEGLKERLFKNTSDIDRGVKKGDPANFSNLVAAFNVYSSDETQSFWRALEFVRQVLSLLKINLHKSYEAAKTWPSIEIIKAFGVSLKVVEDIRSIPNWKELSRKSSIEGVITFSYRGGIQVISRGTKVWKIPVTPNQVFRHATGFTAVYPTYEALFKDSDSFIKSKPSL